MTHVSTSSQQPCALVNNVIIGAFTAALLIIAGLLPFASTLSQ